MLTYSVINEKFGYYELHTIIANILNNSEYEASDEIYKQVTNVYFNNQYFHSDLKISEYADYDYEQAYQLIRNNFYDVTNVLRIAKSNEAIDTIPHFLDVIAIAESVVNVLVDYCFIYVLRAIANEESE